MRPRGDSVAASASLRSIDALAAWLSSALIVPPENVLDGSFSIRDVSRRNRNHRATWGEGDGVLVKQAGPAIADAAITLANEIAFYGACARAGDRAALPLVEMIAAATASPMLVLRLSRHARPLWDWRTTSRDPRTVYRALGDALATLHAFCASAPFTSDAYARSLPDASHHLVFSLHRPSPSMLRTASHAHLDTVRIVQQDTNLGEQLDSLAAKLRPTQVIHGDIKADNILVEQDERVAIVDWELAQRGDPAWDIGGVLADALLFWLFSLSPEPNGDAEATVALATEQTRFTHAACLAFWQAYATSSGAKDDLLTRSVLCSAAHLVRHAFEDCHEKTAISNQAVAALQVAVNLFAEPPQGAEALFGLSSGSG